MESSPYYLYHPYCAKRIHNKLPKVKIIILLRNPIDRAYSNYKMERKKGKEVSDTFQEALDKEYDRIKSLEKNFDDEDFVFLHQNFSYFQRGLYYEQVKRYFNYFDKDQILILKSENFFENPENVLKKIYDFLGVRKEMPDGMKSFKSSYEAIIPKKLFIFLVQKYKHDIHKLEQLIDLKFEWFE